MNEQDKEAIINEVKKIITQELVNAIADVAHEVRCNPGCIDQFVGDTLCQLAFEISKINDK